jgi:DNA-binding transcriptional LysR family regulator
MFSIAEKAENKMLKLAYNYAAKDGCAKSELKVGLTDTLRDKSVDKYLVYDMDVVIEIDSKNALIQFIKANIGIALLSQSNCNRYQDRGSIKILPIADANLKKELYLLCRKDYNNKDVLMKFQYFYNLSKN